MGTQTGSGFSRGVRRCGAISVAVLALAALGGVNVQAAAAATTLYVSQGSADTGTCATTSTPCGTVSHALTLAPSGATIKVSGKIYDHADILNPVTITNWRGGPAGSSAVLDGTGTGQVVTVSPDVIGVTVADLTIENGLLGIWNNGGTLTLTDSTVSGNDTSNAAAGIYNQNGTTTISDSTIANNIGGSTAGAGVYNEGGQLAIIASTISANTGGGISGNQGTVTTLGATIVADQTTGSNCFEFAQPIIHDDGYNLTNDANGTACNFTAAAHDLVNTNPHLGRLTKNGGTTKTMLPATTSPAAGGIPDPIPKLEGVPVCPGTDQRGVKRPGNGDTGCTIGAAEVAFTKPTTTTVTLLPRSVPHGTRVAYVVTVTPNSGSGTPTGTISFTTGATSLCQAVLSGGVAACGATNAPVGTDTITGTYSGGNGFATSSGTATLTVT